MSGGDHVVSVRETAAVLRDLLAGGPVPCRDVSRAIDRLGHGPGVAPRARDLLGVTVERRADGAPCYRLPPEVAP